VRRWIVGDVIGWPAPGLLGAAHAPVAWRFARVIGADGSTVRADVAGLPSLLDRVDELIAADTLGGAEPNAADFQIATAVRVLVAFDDLRAAVLGRPAEGLARRLLPSYPEPIPRALPAQWLTPLGG
jgi:glutathione S-transferase